MKLSVLLASVCLIVGMTGGASAALNTDYTLSPSLYPENTYALVTSSNEDRGDLAWGNYYAPDGHSSFYEFNGGTQSSPLLRIAFETEYFNSGDVYSFSALVVDNYYLSAPVLQLSVDGTLVGNAVTLGGPYGSGYIDTPGPWELATFSFDAASTGFATVALVDTNTASNGNDFSITAVPEASTWAMMLLGFVGLGFAGYRRKAVAVRAAA